MKPLVILALIVTSVPTFAQAANSQLYTSENPRAAAFNPWKTGALKCATTAGSPVLEIEFSSHSTRLGPEKSVEVIWVGGPSQAVDMTSKVESNGGGCMESKIQTTTFVPLAIEATGEPAFTIVQKLGGDFGKDMTRCAGMGSDVNHVELTQNGFTVDLVCVEEGFGFPTSPWTEKSGQ